MSIFGDLDVESAADDPFAVPDNTYKAFLFDVKVGPTKDGTKTGMSLTYKISEGEHEGKQITEWKRIPTPADPKNLDADDQRKTNVFQNHWYVNTVTPEDLIGKSVLVTVKSEKGYTNVKKLELDEDADEIMSKFE